MRILSKIGQGVLCLILVPLTLWMGFLLIGRWIEPTQYPMLFGYSEAGILSGSMEPTLSQGDHVVFHKQESYEIDDVVVYYDPTDGAFVVHRIVGTNGEDFILQGDYNPACDPNPVSPEHIQGKVIFVIENLQPFLYIGFGALIATILQWTVKDFKRMRQKRTEKGGEKPNET